ncbi:hypothetical protein [Streptomyces clavifer]|uniref:hypothetical protein n=1 Tax=Streptomyces TaxID=1883 RepID=UPI00366515A3
MSSSDLRPLVLLLLVLVAGLVVGALVYLSYEHPALTDPLTVAIGGGALLVACVALVYVRR